MSAAKRIKAAMRANERSLLAHIKRQQREGSPVWGFHLGRAWSNALSRLQDKGLVRHDGRSGYIPTIRGQRSR